MGEVFVFMHVCVFTLNCTYATDMCTQAYQHISTHTYIYMYAHTMP